MNEVKPGEAAQEKNATTTNRISDRELVVTRTFNGPVQFVFKAWTTPELFRQWWTPKSFCITIISYEADIRTGGTYRLTVSHPAAEEPMAFFGRYIEVTPSSRLVWTNDEGGEDGAVTTVTFEEKGESTLVVLHELYASKEALDEAIASGATSGWSEQFLQLDEHLAAR